MKRIDFVVPATVTDPRHPSGGNRYDLRLADGLTGLGRDVHLVRVPLAGGTGPPLAAALDHVPDGGIALIDGLVAGADPGAFAAHAGRIRVVLLLHMPPVAGDAAPATAALLADAAGVITTSAWTRDRILDLLPPDGPSPAVATPGVEPTVPVPRSPGGRRLRCVAALLPHKGQDVLLAALGRLRGLDWGCELVGATDLDPGFTSRLHRQATELGIADRVRFAGAHAAGTVRQLYDGADLFVLPSRAESYGMVVAEAIACGLPVVASDVGGVREALGSGRLPGLLVPPDRPAELAQALQDWLTRPELRDALATAALERRERLATWSATARIVDAALAVAEPSPTPSRLPR